MQQLQPNTILQGGKYRIERVLGQGGFGNTYYGFNTVFNEHVAIKEFFMQGINDRDASNGAVSVSLEGNKPQFEEQREKFKKEALRIRKLNNPHIIKVHDLFDENGTAYYVMDYVDGENLAERLKRTGRPMTETEVREILPQILDALKTVHNAGIWHLDLKPANIMVDKSGNVKLIDFGASKQMDTQKQGATTSTAISYTNGYAPREQMEQSYEKFGPWTDIYALGATLYNLLTIRRPPMPSDIDDDETDDKHNALPFPSGVSNEMRQMLQKMMQTNRKQRPQSISEISCISENNDSEETLLANKTSEETILEPKREKTSTSDLNSHHPEKQNMSKGEQSKSNSMDEKVIAFVVSLAVIIACIIAFIFFPSSSGQIENPNANDSTMVLESSENELPVEQEKNEVKDNNKKESVKLKNGYFEEEYDDGSSYKGYFKNDQRHGKGTYFWANGDKYEGDWVDGQRTGKGVYTWSEKRNYHPYRYEGDFKNGVIEGKGIMYFIGGATYDGEFKNGLRHGYGITTWTKAQGKDLYRYIGEYKNDKEDGVGTQYYLDESQVKGEFKEGKLIKTINLSGVLREDNSVKGSLNEPLTGTLTPQSEEKTNNRGTTIAVY